MRWICICTLLPLPVLAAEQVELVTTFQSSAMVRIDDHQHQLSLGGPDVDGVRLLSVSGDEAEVAVDEKAYHLSPGVVMKVGSGLGGSRVVIAMNQTGQYLTSGSINNKPVRFLVDTGANTMAMSRAQADQLGLDYRSGRRGEGTTAGGRVKAWYLLLHQVRVGRIEVDNVVAAVIENDDDPGYMLLGMSFLDRVKLTHDSRRLVLQAR